MADLAAIHADPLGLLVAFGVPATNTEWEFLFVICLLGVVEARARARRLALLAWPVDQDATAEAATAAFVEQGAKRRAHGLLAADDVLFDIAAVLSEAGVGPVSVSRLEFAFEPTSAVADILDARLDV